MKKSLLTAILALAITLTLTSCGEHSLEEILFGESSSSEETGSSPEPGVSSSGGGLPYSFGEDGTGAAFYETPEIDQSSSSGTDNTDDIDIGGGDAPPNDTLPTPPSITNSQGTVIVEPLLKTKWGRGSPFDPFHTLPDGSVGWIACWRVAYTQILKYNNYPYGIDFDWNNMLDSYRNVNLTEQQKNAITTLIHSIYSINHDAPSVFVENFGYDKSIQRHYRKYYDNATWEETIRKQLDSGLPIYAAGWPVNPSLDGHGFVIDGYDSKGKFHINWGWGGTADGYYPIDSLTPNGRTLEDGFHNKSFKIYINIQPDKGSIGSNAMALDSFTVGKTSVSQYELFSIRARIRSLGIFPGGQVGVALVGSNGSIAKVLGIKNFAGLGMGSTRTYSADAFLQDDVSPGQYKLQIVTQFENGQWKLATLSNREANIPSAINITVKPAESGAPGGGYGLGLTKFIPSKTTVSQNELFTVAATLKNFAPSDTFPGGQVGMALVNSSGNIAAVAGIVSFGATNPSASRSSTISGFVPDNVAPGTYRLRMVARPTGGAWKVATMSLDTVPNAINFTVTRAESGAPGGGYGLALETFAPNKTTAAQNELFTVDSKLKNVSPTDTFPSGYLGVALMDESNNIAAVVGIFRHTATRAPGQSYTLQKINCVVPDNVKPGKYKIRTLVKPVNGDEWRVATMFVGDTPTAIDFTVKAAEFGAPGGGYGLALETFAPSKTTVSQNESFTVDSKLKNVSQAYTFPSGFLGVALMDKGNNIVAVVGTFRHTSTRAPGEAYVLKTINCVVPDTVKPGQYKLRTLVKPIDSEEWRVATLAFDGIPTSIDFTVKQQ